MLGFCNSIYFTHCCYLQKGIITIHQYHSLVSSRLSPAHSKCITYYVSFLIINTAIMKLRKFHLIRLDKYKSYITYTYCFIAMHFGIDVWNYNWDVGNKNTQINIKKNELLTFYIKYKTFLNCMCFLAKELQQQNNSNR